MITLYVDVVMGFRQSVEMATGSERLWLRLREFSSRHVHVSLTNWDTNRRAQAEQIERVCDQDCVFIQAGYSWGVGNGCMGLAAELGKRGRSVTRLFSCDGVYHSGLMPWRAIWSPIFGEPVIKLPNNVLQCDYWIQKMDRPRGHKIISDITSRVVFRGELNRVHAYMDEAPEYHNEVIKCVQQFSLAS